MPDSGAARLRLPVVGAQSAVVHDAPETTTRFVHLLYAPTNFCNMGCRYCYLGEGTDAPPPGRSAVETLRDTVSGLLEAGIVPYNLSLHGGEPTAIPRPQLEALFAFMRDYYERLGPRIRAAGFTVPPLHIKTNLLNFHQLEPLFRRFGVSVSASVDLPLSLHEHYRTDKAGGSTLPRIRENLAALARYPHHAKTSCVITRAHAQRVDEVVADIGYIHRDLGLDMTRFNVMFGFDSEENQRKFGDADPGLAALSGDEQVEFYRRIRAAFLDTELHEGLVTHWFKEFSPDFCCSAVNCGDKFYLLQADGDVYSCPRGQSSPRFRYGNVFESPVAEVFAAGSRTIERVENHLEIHDDCTVCSYLPYCNVGCTFVRAESDAPKSYTCQLQKQMYRDDPERYPEFSAADVEAHARHLRFRNNIKSFQREECNVSADHVITEELHDSDNALSRLIERDPVLAQLYADDLFEIVIDGRARSLRSQILSNVSEIAAIRASSKVELRFRSDLLELGCEEPVNNYLHIMLLRNTPVRYGDEGRVKQQHIADYSVYRGALEFEAESASQGYDLMPFLRLQAAQFRGDVRNNLFFTTRALRDHHYRKQQKNAFYHIQAINLPFQNLEFYWVDADARPSED